MTTDCDPNPVVASLRMSLRQPKLVAKISPCGRGRSQDALAVVNIIERSSRGARVCAVLHWSRVPGPYRRFFEGTCQAEVARLFTLVGIERYVLYRAEYVS